ncbi:cytochrome bd-I oxidase subunit CydX [Rhizobium sp. C4]|uniref:cytochrome bd-I oxidase subunit CydX n=1 Tax=Rhizobium sp. C4 TaxID=1349800 RepID=UPI001E43BB69|nr:cytochrome bd-I oxidase subunit CydX [Rhizobium sp. C4]MCD2172281.1 cytochrome bd-I oxidase subunit CydX [Rhizobium sp. C4]
MWYFAWLLGLPLAAIFAVVNAMWLEMQQDRQMINGAGKGNSPKPVSVSKT